MSDNSEATSATRSIGLILVSRGVVLAFQFLSVAIIGRRLGPPSFGVLQFALAIFVYVGLAADLGLTTVGARETARGAGPAMGGALFGARLALTGVAVTMAALGILALPLNPTDRWLGGALIIGTIASVANLRWLAQGLERFRSLVIADVVGAAVQVSAAFVAVRGPDDVVSAGLVMIAAPIVVTLVLLFQPETLAVLKPRLSSETPKLIRAALPLGMAALAIQLYNNADLVLLGVFRGVDTVGWYGAAYKIVIAALAVPVATQAVILPMLARLMMTDDTRIRPLLAAASRGLLLFAIPFAIGLTLTASVVVTTVFGPAYEPSAFPLSVLGWVCVTASANAPFGALMLARRQDRAYLVATGSGSLLNVGVNLLVIPRWGMAGAALTTIVEEALVLAILIWFTRDYAIAILPRAAIRTSAAAAAMAAAVYPLRMSIVALPVGVLTFAVAGTVTGAIPVATAIRSVRSLRKRRRPYS